MNRQTLVAQVSKPDVSPISKSAGRRDVAVGRKFGNLQHSRLGSLRHDGQARASVTVDFAPLKNSRAGELAAKFDFVMEVTPEA